MKTSVTATTAAKQALGGPRGSGGGLEEACPGFFDDVIHDLFEVSGFPVDAQLAIGARAAVEDVVDALDLLAAAEFVHGLVHEAEVLENQVAGGHFFLLAEINQLAV